MAALVKYWVIIPAAGIGVRMDADKPKQYIMINGKTIIEYTLDRFLTRKELAAIVVVLAATDKIWETLPIAKNNQLILTTGGKERHQSVLNGLYALKDRANIDDWVLIHDAARPCLAPAAIDKLMVAVKANTVGGILALPCRDTIKQANCNHQIEQTLERNVLWQAQTPQMFRYGKLVAALENIQQQNKTVTDEAMAMELSGYQPLLVQGHAENIKLTDKADLAAVTLYLTKRL